jgi:hypothetical protein
MEFSEVFIFWVLIERVNYFDKKYTEETYCNLEYEMYEMFDSLYIINLIEK